MNKVFYSIIITLTLFTSCNNNDDEVTVDDLLPDGEIAIETPDWTEETHSNDVDPNYAVVFPENKVLELKITIDEEFWDAMQQDLDDNLGGAGPSGIDFTPIWVPATLEFEGIEWYKIGIRYKGNSTLINSYRSNTDKYPFKLDFDEFEDNYPDINNQRFYGFKQLNLGNNSMDDSFIREKVSTDLFRNFGVVSARTSFCAVYLDRGNGSQYIGLYTLVEEVDNTIPESQFEDSDGNLYKPDGDAASFAFGTYDESEMDLKTNEDIGDYSDVYSLYELLHDASRTSDPETWKSNLESIFDVDAYLKYLAVNQTIQNWDTYGIMTHNYFLYNNNGKLCWIPWDNNEAMQDGKMGGALSLSLDEVSSNWPIIRYIMDVEEYQEIYKQYLSEFTNNFYNSSFMDPVLESHESLITSYATEENSSFSFNILALKSHVTSRNTAVENFLE